MTQPLELFTVQQSFEQWRQQRVSRRETTPLALRQQAIALCEYYPISQMIDALRINHTVLKQWRQQETTPSFVPLDLSVPSASPAVQATLMHPNGTQLQLNGLNTQAFHQLIHQFILMPVSDT